MRNHLFCVAGLVALLFVAACSEQAPKRVEVTGPVTPTYIADGKPARLSEWGQVAIREGQLVLGDGVLPYDLNSALFSDHALKLRTVWKPGGTAAVGYDADEVMDFPIGTVISKSFYYKRGGSGLIKARAVAVSKRRGIALDAYRLIETRILVHREGGWQALSYVWDDDQGDASLARIGALIDLDLVANGERQTFTYAVPTEAQCGGCHISDHSAKAIKPIGPKARHLNGDYAYHDATENQLARWTKAGFLTGVPDGDLDALPRSARWDDASLPIDQRARAYLDINCSHCHSPKGPADTSGLWLNPAASGAHLGVCKLPIAAGKGTGGRRYDIVPGQPDASIIPFRMKSDRPDAMMPELGRSLVHQEGASLIEAWITGMQGAC